MRSQSSATTAAEPPAMAFAAWHVRCRQRLLMIHLWMAPLLLAVPATVNPAPAFGRLEHRPEHYNIVVGGRSLASKRLQISANGSRGLRLRFIGDEQ